MDNIYLRDFSKVRKLVIFTLICVFLYFAGLKIIIMLLPFIFAGIISLAMEPIVSFFQRKLKFKRVWASLFSLVIVLSILISIISLIIYSIIIELIKLSTSLPLYLHRFEWNNELKYIQDLGQRFYLSVPPEAASIIQPKVVDAITAFSNQLIQFVTSILSGVFNIIQYSPQILIFVIVTAVSTYFMSKDKEKISQFILRQFSEKWQSKIIGLKKDLFIALIGFVKTQMIIIVIAISIVTVGLLILRVNNAVAIGVLIGSAEILPIVGIGTILVPWIIYSLFTKNLFMAIGLACIYLTGIIVRQSTEPRILGAQIGVYPLVTLMAIYIGLNLFGPIGVIFGPITVIILRNLNRSGIIHLWK